MGFHSLPRSEASESSEEEEISEGPGRKRRQGHPCRITYPIEEHELVEEGEKEMVTYWAHVYGNIKGSGPAVVDAAAQVTLISSELFIMLRDPPPVKREVVMNTAGGDFR